MTLHARSSPHPIPCDRERGPVAERMRARLLRALALGAVSRPARDIPQARTSYQQAAARARPLVAQGKRQPAASLLARTARGVGGEPWHAVGTVETSRVAGWEDALDALDDGESARRVRLFSRLQHRWRARSAPAIRGPPHRKGDRSPHGPDTATQKGGSRMKTKRTFTPVILVNLLVLAWLPMASFGQAPTPPPIIFPPPIIGFTVPTDPTVTQHPPTLGDIQAAFDFFSWQSFVALNWPADPQNRGFPNTAATLGGPGPVVWETFNEKYEVFQAGNPPPPPPRSTLRNNSRRAAPARATPKCCGWSGRCQTRRPAPRCWTNLCKPCPARCSIRRANLSATKSA